MYQEILKKKALLDQYKPFRAGLRMKLRERNKLDLVYSVIKFNGTCLSRQDVEDILNGKLIKEASLKEYVFIENYLDALRLAFGCLELGSSMNRLLFLRFHGMLTGKGDSQLRGSSPLLADFGYVPPHQSTLEASLDKLFRELYRNEENEIERAAFLHNALIALYPFEQYSEAMARFTMNYYLMEKGFEPVALGFSREEYLKATEDYLKKKDEAVFYRGLERAVYNKLDVVLQIIAADEEEASL